MDLDFSDEQDLLRDTVRDLCAKHVPPDDRARPGGRPGRLPGGLLEAGRASRPHGMRLPEEHGGSGMTLLDAALVYTELGRALAPSPHFVSSVLAGRVLATAGSAEQRERWLPRIAAGDGVVTPAWLEPDGGCGPSGVRAQASRRRVAVTG